MIAILVCIKYNYACGVKMCQILRTEQFMGVMAVSFLSEGRKSVSLNNFYEIQRKVSKHIRQSELDAILCISQNEIYATISEYSTLFEMKNHEISFFDDKMNIYKNYFYSGISKKITDCLTSCILDK